MNRVEWAPEWLTVYICPTRVGMNRLGRSYYFLMHLHLPHTRGDEPWKLALEKMQERDLPHTRGDEPDALDPERLASSFICPTRVGMNRAL